MVSTPRNGEIQSNTLMAEQWLKLYTQPCVCGQLLVHLEFSTYLQQYLANSLLFANYHEVHPLPDDEYESTKDVFSSAELFRNSCI